MELVKKICSLLTLIVLVLTECFIPINYSFAENDDAEDFQVEENITQEDNEASDESYDEISETEENAEEDVKEDADEEIFDEDSETNEEEDKDEENNEDDNVEDSSEDVENNEDEETFDDNSETNDDEENNKDSSEEVENNEDEETLDDNSETNDSEESPLLTGESQDEVNGDTEPQNNDNSTSEGQIGSEIDSSTPSQNDDNTGTQGNNSEESPLLIGEGQGEVNDNTEPQNNDNEEPQEEDEENEENKGIIDEISEEVQNIIEKIRYFFKRDGSSKYIKYGSDSKNIGTITLKDPETGVSITIMDKNLGAESAGIGKNSYGYYFQWGNNHGVKTVNSSNKTTQKAVYNDSYDNRGYDGEGNFIVGSTDYWENGAHYNNLWGNESKESSRYGACPAEYHIPTMKEWNQLLNIWGKIHTQDTSAGNTVSRYSANYPAKEIHTFKGAATQCAQGDTDCVDEDNLSSIVNILSSELKLPLAGGYDENGNYHDGVGIYWTSVSKYSNTAGVFDMNAYFGEGGNDALIYKAQGHNIRCFQNIYAYEAPVIPETENNETSGSETNDSEESPLLIGEGQGEVNGDTEPQNNGENTQDTNQENDIPSDIESNPAVQDTTGDLINEETNVIEYTITWKNEDGSIRDTTKVACGQMPIHEDPVQPSDAQYSYQFAGWEPELKVVDGDAEYKAKYTYIPMTYTITWKNEDGTIRDTTKVAYGQMPTHADPVQPADAHYSYTFAGWEPTISEVKGNAEYKAKYTYTVNKYTITWKDGDGNVLKTDELEYGSNPSYDETTPVKESDGNYEYTFAGWEPEISEVMGNAEYVAIFDKASLNNGGAEGNEADGLGNEVDSSTSSQNDNAPSGTQGNENEGPYSSFGGGGGGNTQGSSANKSASEGQSGSVESGSTLNLLAEIFEAQAETGEVREYTDADREAELLQIWNTLNEKEIEGRKASHHIIVDVSAPIGAFPEGTQLRITPIENQRMAQELKDQLVENTDVTEDSELVSFDITFIYTLSNGEEIELQPAEGKTVKVSFNYEYNDNFSDADNNENKELKVYHFEEQTDNEGNKTEDVEVEEIEINQDASSEGKLVIDAEKFSIYTIVTQQFEHPQRTNTWKLGTDYFEIELNKKGSTTECITIMDRNLGATATGYGSNATADARGYYYQYGNNYGFTPTSAGNQISGPVNVSDKSYGEYSSGMFVKRAYWMSSFKELWGGTTANVDNMQGPCPDGRHVGNRSDWNTLHTYWRDEKGYTFTTKTYLILNISSAQYQEYLTDLLIPNVGYLKVDGTLNNSSYVYLWTSEKTSNASNSNQSVYRLYGTNKMTTDSNAVGWAMPVRCFKNTYTCKQTSDCELDDGTVVLNGTTITGYQAPIAASGSYCYSEQITCNNGVLNGTSRYASCDGDVRTGTTTLSYVATITATPNGYGIVSTGSVTQDEGATITTNGSTITIGGTTVTATPTTDTAERDYEFVDWTNTCGNTLTGNCTITANFTRTKNQYTATITTTPNGYGTVSTGSVTKDYGATISINGSTITIGGTTVTATPTTDTAERDYEFVDWTNTCGNTLTGDCTITAQFKRTTNKYLITFKDGNGSTIQSGMIEYGTTPAYNGATPTKTADAQYTYTWNNTWSPAIHSVTGNQTYTAQFNSTVNEYTITWNYRDANGERAESSGNVAYGQNPTAPSLPPTSQSQSTVYTFTSWSPAVHSVTGTETYTAQYNESPRQYTITWKNDDGTTIDTTTVNYGATPTHANATKANTAQYTYTFSGWTPTIESVTGDATYTAEFNSTVNEYEVTIISSNINSGTVSTGSVTVPYGTSISASSNPLTIGGTTVTATPNGQTEQYTYAFKDWTNTCGNEVEGTCTITANFTSTLRSYTITWENEDGTPLETDTDVPYGTMPTYDSATPQKAATEEFTYTFDTWSPAVRSVTGDATYTATYTSTVNVYTASIAAMPAGYGTVNKSSVPASYGTPISTSNNTLTIGSTTVTATPTTSDAQYTYTFTGWTFNNCRNQGSEQIRSGCNITANFERTVNTYTITWKNEGGATLETDTDVPYGDIPTYDGATPQKTGSLIYSYVFSGWTPAISEVHGNQTYTATYTQTLRKHTVTWRNTDGSTLETDEDVGHGATPEYNGSTPTDGVSNQYVTSTFAGWNPATGTVEKDVEYMARYTYTVPPGMILDTSKDSVKVTLNANGGQFSNNSGYDVLNYDYYNRAEKKYAHSANYSDDGTRSTAASSSDAKQYLTTITGAEHLYVHVIYDLHEILLGLIPNNKDKLDIYAGKTTSDTVVAHFSGNHNDGIQGSATYNITGDSVLINFTLANRNISSMESNGFHAVIVGVIPVGYITNDEAQTPSRQGYTFDGWYTQAESGDEIDIGTLSVSGNMEVYAHWIPNTGIQYTVYHYVKIAGENSYALSKTETLSGTTDEVLVFSALAKENEFLCAHYDRGSLTGRTSGPGPVVTQTTLNGDGSTQIYLYYIRLSHTVHLTGDEHIQMLKINGVETQQASFECGSEVPIDATPKPGYHFVRWEEEEREESEDDDPEPPPGE